MATSNVTATISKDELFEAFQEQVDPSHHDVLRKEIERRWPDGLRVLIHLEMPAEQSAKPEK